MAALVRVDHFWSTIASEKRQCNNVKQCGIMAEDNDHRRHYGRAEQRHSFIVFLSSSCIRLIPSPSSSVWVRDQHEETSTRRPARGDQHDADALPTLLPPPV
ncbi:hypothetical protein DPEC_G00142190 [Dallia pectoralis]|uniref:Uncharacterized protein n=1 Tax=Dallia pectoralis TaxID=75939 RepID=A0ACC2GMM3_DALPE|nr:hypothetical protein DPEC_G00142190 [Dallia pectoralis]